VSLSALTKRTSATPGGFKKTVYPNFSFDYSSHDVPIAYTALDNAVELHSKVKLNTVVPMKGGGYLLDVPLDQTIFEEFEMDIEFTINSDIENSRHLMIFFSRNEPNPKDFTASQIGYKTDYEGIGIYLFRHMAQENKWYLMTVQNSGVANMFKGSTKLESGLYSSNSCFATVERGVRLGIRV
jgi:hypothetical protein